MMEVLALVFVDTRMPFLDTKPHLIVQKRVFQVFSHTYAVEMIWKCSVDSVASFQIALGL